MKKKMLLKLLSAAISLFLALTVALLVYVTIFADGNGIFGLRLFVVSTGSMETTIMQGELIIVKKIDTDKLSPEEDIITFISDDPEIRGEINTHRVNRIENGRVYTKGDANRDEDIFPVDTQKILGKVTGHSRFFGKIIRTLKNPRNMVVFIIVPVMIIAILDILSNSKKIKRIISDENTENCRSDNSLSDNNDSGNDSTPADNS